MDSDTSKKDSLPVVLTIAGSDSGAGAGIQADLQTFTALKTFGTSAISSLTAQNPDGVSDIFAVSPEFVVEQIKQVTSYFDVKAAKTGMLFDAAIIEAVAKALRKRPGIQLVVDPVMVSTSGARLLKEDALEALKTTLFPRAAILTPNLDEVEVLLGEKPTDDATMEEAARKLSDEYKTAVLVKGGHLEGERLIDVLCLANGDVSIIESTRITDVNTHGSGCRLSAAICSLIGHGQPVRSAVRGAHSYLNKVMREAVSLSGIRFIGHG